MDPGGELEEHATNFRVNYPEARRGFFEHWELPALWKQLAPHEPS